MAKQRIHLVIIDPQNDFCDLPETHRPMASDGSRLTPSLPVPGAHADLLRVAGLIERGGAGLSAITVTLDALFPDTRALADEASRKASASLKDAIRDLLERLEQRLAVVGDLARRTEALAPRAAR